MVLHHVTKRPHRVVKLAAIARPEVLGHRDLNSVDASAAPQIGHGEVREPQVLDLDHRLLAEEVIHEQDLPLVEDLTEASVQLPSRLQVVPERLLHRNPGISEQAEGI